MNAYCLIRDQPWYRREAFVAGLRAAGHEVLLRDPPDRIDRNTLVVMWNRYAHWHEIAKRVEAGGGRVIVSENGFIGKGGTSPKFDVHPHGPKPWHYYALAEGFHNGGGRAPDGTGRWERLGVELKPWRAAGEHILICPNRSFGPPERVMHPDWAQRVAARLRQVTKRPIRIREHPGTKAPARPLAEDLKNCWAMVIWSSSCGVHALAEGIPVFCEAPFWIMKAAAAGGSIEAPTLPERLPHFERLAFAQWTIDEISSGEPFRRLLAS